MTISAEDQERIVDDVCKRVTGHNWVTRERHYLDHNWATERRMDEANELARRQFVDQLIDERRVANTDRRQRMNQIIGGVSIAGLLWLLGKVGSTLLETAAEILDKIGG